MKKIVLSLIGLCIFCGGCISTTTDKNHPIVSPTNIQEIEQDKEDPILPTYIPWWKD